ncbi:MAG TPA: glycosyl hydrolase [Bacillota bacterium]|nr:glycosyl hydrolase [Bacillota bacterium]
MRKWTSRLVLLLLCSLAVYYIYKQYRPLNHVKLPPPDEPPFFSVSYLWGYSPSQQSADLLDRFKSYRQEIENIALDLKDIGAAGFNGIKLCFYYNQDNTLIDWTAGKAAEERLYPIGLLTGHNRKSKGRAFTEEELRRWERFVRQEVKKNRDIIYYWEVWNEPDIDLYRYGIPKEYLELLKRTAAVIKRENPEAKVIMAIGAVDSNGVSFLEEVLSSGGGNYFDILGFHPYAANPYIRKDIFNKSVETIKNINEQYGNRWPLWITEIGQPTSEVSGELQAESAEFVFKRACEEKIPVIWFHYSDKKAPGNAVTGRGWGLLDACGMPKPSYERLKAVMSGVSDARTHQSLEGDPGER